jgi:hypothetical protein
MKTLKTISGRVLKVSSNKQKRTFTIVTESNKFRTIQMSKEEFYNALYWTGNDWQNFLKTDEYYPVK